MTENSIRLLEPSFKDSAFADFIHRAEQDPSSLSPNEVVRWDAYMTAAYRHFGNLVYQYRVGVLDEQMWQSYRLTLKEHLRPHSRGRLGSSRTGGLSARLWWIWWEKPLGN